MPRIQRQTVSCTSAEHLIRFFSKHAYVSDYIRDALHRIAALVWCCFLGIGPVHLRVLCCPVSSLTARLALHSSGGKLLVPHGFVPSLLNLSSSGFTSLTRQIVHSQLLLFLHLEIIT